MDMNIFKQSFIGKRIKNKNLTDVSIVLKNIELHSDEFEKPLQLDVVWMNDLYEMEIGSDTLYIHPETLTEWYIYEPIKQASE
jgi:hypothetical protein